MLGSVSSWVLSIAGVVCVSVLVELLMPDGQMNRYIKGIFAFIIILVIIAPLPKLLNSDFDYSNIFSFENKVEIDENYVYQINLDKINEVKSKIENDINKQGYENVAIYINSDIFDNAFLVKSIYVDLSCLCISKNAEHNDITRVKKHITQIIQNYLNVDEEEVLYND